MKMLKLLVYYVQNLQNTKLYSRKIMSIPVSRGSTLLLLLLYDIYIAPLSKTTQKRFTIIKYKHYINKTSNKMTC